MAPPVRPNPKYRHVQSVTDTGNSRTKQLQRIKELHQFYRCRPDEIFRRVTLPSLIRLMVEVAKLEYQVEDIEAAASSLVKTSTGKLFAENVDKENLEGPWDEFGSRETVDPHRHLRSGLSNIIAGTGHSDLPGHGPQNLWPARNNTFPPSEGEVSGSRPFLLLDVRPTEDHARGHLRTADSYPARSITRAVNYETRAMLHYKNKEGKLVVVYDFDESTAPAVATALAQRGYANVFVLSGGMKLVQARCPASLVRDVVPGSSRREERLCEEDIRLLEAFLEETEHKTTRFS